MGRSAADFPETVVHKDAGVPLRARRGRIVFKRLSVNNLDNPTGLRLRWFTRKDAGSLIRDPATNRPVGVVIASSYLSGDLATYDDERLELRGPRLKHSSDCDRGCNLQRRHGRCRKFRPQGSPRRV